MTRERIISEITASVVETIERTVNGKIQRVSEQISEQNNKIHELSDDVREIKMRMKPITDVYSNATGFWKTILALAVFAGSIGGLVASFNAILSFLHIR